jgi:predicted nicotinamide N-methyase
VTAGAGAGSRRVITETTRLATVPYVPEIRLQQAEDPFTVWEQTESVAGRSTGGVTGADTGQAELPPPFWAFAWAGGQALARYLLDHPDLVAGRHVLDVASGSGLVAIAAARCGARPVLAADVDELAAQAISVNAAANGARVRPVLADLLDGDGDGADVVLCADAFYEEELAVRVLAFLHRARAAGARVFVGDPGRAFLRTAGFVPLETYEIPVTVALEGVTSKRATVYEVTDSENGG